MKQGKPIWPEGRECEMNLFVGFRAVAEVSERTEAALRIAASSLYRAFLNGEFVGHGPARAAHGFHRVDEWPLQLAPGRNVIAVEVAGYCCNSYYLPDQPSFLQAEVICGGQVLAATGSDAFAAAILDCKLQKVHRFGGQRTFSEVYRMGPGWDAWRRDPAAPFAAVPCAVFGSKQLLPRRVSYPEFALRAPAAHVSSGRIERGVKPDEYWTDRFVTEVGPTRKGFVEEDVEAAPMIELQETRAASCEKIDRPLDTPPALELAEDAFHILDFGIDLTGFIAARVICRRPTRLFLTFDELLCQGDVDFTRNHTINVVAYDLEPGSYDLESFEPYTFRYLKLTTFDGDCTVENVRLRELANPDVRRARFAASDDRLNRIFEAGRETLRQNALDIFMDCPSRERAGWLCDSFFTARAAADLCGNAAIERNFYENFLLPDRFEHLPDGMLPMCYPADHLGGTFIPNWAMWFVVELEEYLARSGDRAMADALKSKVFALFDYFKGFENDGGLLEKLDKWVFVEWSRANDFVQDVSYPTNALYAGALDAAARMYGLDELAQEADRIREVIRAQSFNGTFFVDNAVRKDGALERTGNTTETCQYYLFYFGVATPETHPDLWRTLVEQFGPNRDAATVFPDVHPSNAFIGNVLRLELLSRYGLCRQLLDECADYHLYMAERTGTLWEMISDDASCNHGFASHVVHVLYRDVLGVHRIDRGGRQVELRFADLPLKWCEGRIPVGDSAVGLKWRQDAERICFRVEVPAGYGVKVSNLSGKELVRES